MLHLVYGTNSPLNTDLREPCQIQSPSLSPIIHGSLCAWYHLSYHHLQLLLLVQFFFDKGFFLSYRTDYTDSICLDLFACCVTLSRLLVGLIFRTQCTFIHNVWRFFSWLFYYISIVFPRWRHTDAPRYDMVCSAWRVASQQLHDNALVFHGSFTVLVHAKPHLFVSQIHSTMDIPRAGLILQIYIAIYFAYRLLF